MRRGTFGLLLCFPLAALAQQPATPAPLLSVVDARENVVSNQVPPTRTGTDYSTFGVPERKTEFGADVPVATGLTYSIQSTVWNALQVQFQSVPAEPSRDPRPAMLAVAPKQPGARPGLVVVITEWWEDGYDRRTCRKALSAYAVGFGGAVLAQSSAADHECLLTFGKSEMRRRQELFSSLLTTPSMLAALKGQVAAPPIAAPLPGATPPPPPPPGAAPVPAPAAPAAASGGCNAAQVAKLKGYGLSDDDIRRTCTAK